MTPAHEQAAYEARMKALLAQRQNVREDIAIEAMNFRAQVLANGNLSPDFNEDAFLVLYAQFKQRQQSENNFKGVSAFLAYLGCVFFVSGFWSAWLFAWAALAFIGAWGCNEFAKMEHADNDRLFWNEVNTLKAPITQQAQMPPEKVVKLVEPERPLTNDPASVFDSPRRR